MNEKMNEFDEGVNDLIETIKNTSLIEKLNPPQDYCGHIYVITCKVTNMSYIGQTKSHRYNPSKNNWIEFGYLNRFKEHIRDSKNLKRDTSISHAIRENSEESNWIVELICECTLDELDDNESYYVKEYNTMLPNGYNMIGGGKDYKNVSDVVRMKIAKASSNHWSNDESKSKLSKSMIDSSDPDKINKVNVILDKISRCRISTRQATSSEKVKFTKLALVFYENRSNSPIQISKSRELIYGNFYTSMEDVISRIINLFDNLDKRFIIEIDDADIYKKYNFLSEKHHNSSEHNAAEIEKLSKDLEKINKVNCLIDSISKCKIYYYDKSDRLTAKFYNNNGNLIKNENGNAITVTFKSKNVSDMIHNMITLFSKLDEEFPIEFDDENLKMQYKEILLKYKTQ